jgi:hypothetical protein
MANEGPVNGGASQQPQVQVVIPQVKLLYRQDAAGARMIVAVEIAGHRFGGVSAARTSFDMTEPKIPGLPNNVIKLHLEAFWPFEWEEEGQQIVVAGANAMPPEPGRGPRGVVR